jgi:hypothetical protein
MSIKKGEQESCMKAVGEFLFGVIKLCVLSFPTRVVLEILMSA